MNYKESELSRMQNALNTSGIKENNKLKNITICRARNGFIVYKADMSRHEGPGPESSYVFSSFDIMIDWLTENLDGV